MGITGLFEHDSSPHSQGENLYWSSGSSSFLEATQAWLDEKPLYNGEALPMDGDIEGQKRAKEYGHYTQMIWPETLRVGMGMFVVPEDNDMFGGSGTYVVARYDQCQISGQTAWRPSRENPYAAGVVRGAGSGTGADRAWDEEEWIRKYGPGRLLL